MIKIYASNDTKLIICVHRRKLWLNYIFNYTTYEIDMYTKKKLLVLVSLQNIKTASNVQKKCVNARGGLQMAIYTTKKRISPQFIWVP